MKRACVYLAAAVLLLSSAVLAQSAPPIADTYSNAGKNSTGFNYGTATLLVVQTNGSNSYLQFNLSTVPAGATINKATLRLFVDAMVTPGSFDVYQLNIGWFESTLTFNNAPPLGVSATGNHPVAVSKVNQFVMVDITSLVQNWQNGTIPNNGIALATTTATGSFSFDSKESTLTSHQPELEIVLAGVAGATGPAGPQGVQGVQGVAGATGATGPAGTTGAIGPQGVAGPIGPQGIKGDTGATGPQGTQGAQGLTGTTGATGAVGAKGDTGATGSQGVQGPVGNTGATGATGAIGPQGAQGLTGNTGAIGPQGVAGPVGPQGNKGDTGATGPQGAQGTQGLTGNTGATGPVGPTGFTGAQGPAGNDGAAGTNGTGFNFTGAFDPSKPYNAYDVATYLGSTYDAMIPIAANSGTPDLTPGWLLMAQMGTAGTPGAPGPAGSTGPVGAVGPVGSPGATGAAGAKGDQGVQGFPGVDGATGPAGPAGPQGTSGDMNARMIFPSFYPGNLTGTWVGGQFTLDQAITVLRIAAVAKTATGATCPAAVFRLTNSTKGQDLVLTPGQNWSDTGAMVMTFAAGDVLQASLRTGSTCASNTGADANLLVEYKMQAAGDTDACSGSACGGSCTSFSSDPSNCGACGTLCPSGQACTNGACPGSCSGGQVFCNGACTNEQTDNNNCGKCGNACTSGSQCTAGVCASLLPNGSACVSAGQCLSGNCTGGVCTAGACPVGQVLCSNTCVNEQTDPNNCGGCGVACSTNNGTPACQFGLCAIQTCNAGFQDCDHNSADGCEVNTKTDPNNCGGCGAVCSTNNGTPACQFGACAVQTCNSGFQDCDHNPANGCEVNTTTDTNNCGACGHACISGQSCTASLCVGAPIGGFCNSNAGCASNICDFVSSTCVGNFCVDQRKDSAETDIDCGGGTCGACGVGKGCLANTDCSSNACDAVTSTCASSQCTDQRKDGVETDIDCGGANSCARCALSQGCQLNTDCASNACNVATHLCVSSQCTDQQKDGLETDIDCGGGICSKCSLGLKCSLDTDCSSNACDAQSLTCVSNQCSDHRQDGTETDIDCGGNSCSACLVGQHCLANSDCGLGHVCNGSHVCQ
jgi:hypothetical protein